MLGFNNSWLRFHLHGYVGLNTGRRFPLSPNLLGRAFSWELLGPAHSKNVCASHSCVSHCKNVCATHLCVSDSHSHGFPCVEQSSFYFLSFFSFFLFFCLCESWLIILCMCILYEMARYISSPPRSSPLEEEQYFFLYSHIPFWYEELKR